MRVEAMLEVRQPSEALLLRELTALQRARSLRDPSTTSSWKSPVLGASSSSNPSWKSPAKGSSLGRAEGDTSSSFRHESGDELLTACTNGRNESKNGGSTLGYLRAEQLSSSDARVSWDLGIDGSVREDRMVGDELHDRIQRQMASKDIRIGGLQGEAMRNCQGGGKVLLHNWRDTSWTDGYEGAPLAAETGENGQRPETVVFRRDSSWAPDDFENQREIRRTIVKERLGRDRNHSKTPSRNFNGDFFSKQGAQILSPLILNSHEDVQIAGRSMSLFTLEEPSSEDDRSLKEGLETGLNAIHREISNAKFASRSQSPLLGRDTMKSNGRKVANTNWKTQRGYVGPHDSNQWTGPMSNMWDAHSIPTNDEIDASELPRSGCGIPCYWSKNQRKGKSLLDLASLSCGLSDSARKKNYYRNSRHCSASNEDAYSDSYTSDRPGSQFDCEVEALPLLKHSKASVGSKYGAASSADESDGLSSDLNGELGIETSSALNGFRHIVSNVPDKGRLELAVLGGNELVVFEERPRSLSQKYRPKVFGELVGQNIVVQALSNAIVKGKIAPVYLFQGSRGTGKTSTARIFAAALNCLAPGDKKPCGFCRECLALTSGKSTDVKEVDAASNNGIEKVKALLEITMSVPSRSHYKVFIIDECHVLTTETWNALLKILEEPPANVVFILTTTDPDQLPLTAVSRCQKFLFPKVKDSEIISRLQKVADSEKLEIEADALELIAARSDGSLRDAETILDQLSLLGQRINLSTVHQLVGSVSDERLFGLLDFALSADTVSTVRRARELVESGVEPLALMSQLATLITDILAGSHKSNFNKSKGGFFHRHTLSEEELERLRIALRILSEAEKQLRASTNDRTTWLTAALLQFGPDRSFLFAGSSSGTSITQSPVLLNDAGDIDMQDYEALADRHVLDKVADRQVLDIAGQYGEKIQMNSGLNSKLELTEKKESISGMNMRHSYGFAAGVAKISSMKKFEARVHPADHSPLYSDDAWEASKIPEKEQVAEASLTHSPHVTEENQRDITLVNSSNLDDIWDRVLERCWSLPLRQLLRTQAKLLSISVSEVDALAHMEFLHPDHKSRGERSRKSIANAFQTVLGVPVEVKISLASLPADGGKMNCRNRVAVDPSCAIQIQSKKTNSAASMDGRLQSDEIAFEGNSLHTQRSRGGVMLKLTTKQADSSQSFPAIRQAPNNVILKEHFEAEGLSIARSPNNLSGADGDQQAGQRLYSSAQEEERLENAWIQEARKLSPMHLSEHRNLKDMTGFPNEFAYNNGTTEETEMIVNDQNRHSEYDHMNGITIYDDEKIDNPDVAFSSFHEDDTSSADLEEENLRLESRLSYGGLLCWKTSNPDELKARRHHQKKKSGLLVRLVPCAKTKNQ